MKKIRLVILTIILTISLLVFTAPLISAEINLLDNPGFESGTISPWWGDDVVGAGRTGAYSAYLIGEDKFIGQDIEPACAQYVSFWIKLGPNQLADSVAIIVKYSDDTTQQQDISLPIGGVAGVWEQIKVDLDQSRLVERIYFGNYIDANYFIDDVDLEACENHSSVPEFGFTIPLLISLALVPLLILRHRKSMKISL